MCVISLCTRGALDTWSRGGSTAALYGTGDDIVMAVGVRGLLLGVLAAVYYFGLRWAVGFIAPMPISAWVESWGVDPVVASYVYFVLSHTLAVLLVAVPLGALVSWSFPRRYFACGIVIALPVLVEIGYEFSLAVGRESMPTSQLIVWVTDFVKLALAIPALAWLFLRYVPYNRMQRTRYG
jgi:hypothetical protein